MSPNTVDRDGSLIMEKCAVCGVYVWTEKLSEHIKENHL